MYFKIKWLISRLTLCRLTLFYWMSKFVFPYHFWCQSNYLFKKIKMTQRTFHTTQICPAHFRDEKTRAEARTYIYVIRRFSNLFETRIYTWIDVKELIILQTNPQKIGRKVMREVSNHQDLQRHTTTKEMIRLFMGAQLCTIAQLCTKLCTIVLSPYLMKYLDPSNVMGI